MNKLALGALPVLVGALAVLPQGAPSGSGALAPGSRVLLDAHNAYPYQGRWSDRLDRALSTGLPLAVEQDLVWHGGRSIVSHGEPFTGAEPSLGEHFFERIRPLVEAALKNPARDQWPLITLNLDLKSNEPEHHRALWQTLGRYEEWLTTAVRTSSIEQVTGLRLRPLLVLTGDDPAQQRSFHDDVPMGATLRLFGAVPRGAPSLRRNNYRRWVNYPWSAVEPEGQPLAGAWTWEDEARLTGLVTAAHDAGLWIRFYTLNGHAPGDDSGGWSLSYNFGSLEAARERWDAAIRAGVDFIAVDQYEALAARLGVERIVLEGEVDRDDYERVLELPFAVPAGTRHVGVDLRYDDAHRTVLDLGLHGSTTFRGWSGGGPQRIFVGEHSASFGYTAGPIESGTWNVLLGVPNVRPGVTARYRVTVTFDGEADAPVLRSGSAWYAGDLHLHSGHSDGRTLGAGGVRLRVPPQKTFEAAARTGLDFMALTDHNTAAHWADVDRLQVHFPALLLLHGREVTTYQGHMNTFGERRFVDFRVGDSRDLAALATELAAAGSFVSINHPDAPDDETCMGCGWNARDDGTMSSVHGVEIVNGDDSQGSRMGWPFWAAMLNRGHRLTAVGGSDEHTPDEIQDRGAGRPTTMVYARELSEAGIVDGLHSGRVYIRTQGVHGPALEFTAIRGDRIVQMGGNLAAGRATLQARLAGAAGQRLEWIRNGSVTATAAVGATEPMRLNVDARPGDWFALVLRDGATPTVYSNAIYVER